MKTNNLRFLSFFVLLLVLSNNLFGQQKPNYRTFSPPDSVTIANGTKISYVEFKKACDNAWNASFGQMTETDKKLFHGTNLIITTDEKKIFKP
jgi:hypothetical protein